MKKTYEYWGIKANGDKFHDHIETKRTAKAKVIAEIEKQEGIEVAVCLDFGYSKVE